MFKFTASLLRYLCYSCLLLLAPWLGTQWYYQKAIQPFATIKPAPTAIVFGAGLNSHNTPSAILAERIHIAVKLYQQGKVKTILLSGDGLNENHNEPAAMRNLAIKLGIPTDALILDYAGNDTYNTCLNAKDIFDIEQAILVTQPFHLPRALFICNNLGIESEGIDFLQQKKPNRIQLYRHAREIIATFAAWVEVWGNRLR